MKPLVTALGALVLWLAHAGPSQAQIRPETLRIGKQATALIVLPSGRGFASSFCIDARGYFITNRHAVDDGPIKIVLHSGDEGEKTLDAVVVRKDDALDLALLKAATDEKLPALKLAEKVELIETQPVIAFGYPFGTALRVKEQQYPNVSVNVGRITSLRKANARLEMIQTDAEVNRGNSGGPLVSEAGEVLGVVTLKVANTGVSFALPSDRVLEFLNTPELQLDMASVAHEHRYDPQPFRLRVASFGPKSPAYRLQLRLGQGQSQRQFDFEPHEGDEYRTEAALLVKPAAGKRLPVEIVVANGLVRGDVEDAKVPAGEAGGRLEQLKNIEPQDGKWRVVGRSGKQVTVAKPLLKKLIVKLGDANIDLPWSSVKSLTIYQPEPEPQSVAYEVVALSNGKPVATLRGELAITGRPVEEAGPITERAPATGEYRPPTELPKLGDEQLVVRLSSPYRECIVGGSGRYFIAHLQGEKKIVIFDIVAGRVVRDLRDVSDDALLAASREKLVIVLPGQKLMQRFDLATLEREKVAPLPGKGITLRALMGASSDGPLLLGAEDAALVDLQSLEPIAVQGELIGAGKDVHIHTSYDGQTVAGIPTGYGPVAYTRMKLDGGRAERQNFSSTSNAIRYAWPTADGSLIAVTGSTLFGPQLEELPAKWLDGATVFPTVDPRYFVAARGLFDEQQKKHVCHLHFCTVAERQIVHTLVGLEELAKEAAEWQSTFTQQINGGNERIYYLPWANVIVTLPPSNQEIVVRRFDLLRELERTGVEYLFVDSIPPNEVVRGDTLRYAIAVQSKSAAVEYRLEIGPDGATVSDEGVVKWNVPREVSDGEKQFVVAIKNGVGKEILHSFSVKLKDAVTVVESSR